MPFVDYINVVVEMTERKERDTLRGRAFAHSHLFAESSTRPPTGPPVPKRPTATYATVWLP